MTAPDLIRRRSFYIGDALQQFIQAGGVPSKSLSDRLDKLAGRYEAMVQDLIPQRWSLIDWSTIVSVIAELSIDRPGDASVLGARVRHKAKAKAGASDMGSLAYRFDGLRLAEQVAIADLAERAWAAGATSGDELRAWLDGQGVSTI